MNEAKDIFWYVMQEAEALLGNSMIERQFVSGDLQINVGLQTERPALFPNPDMLIGKHYMHFCLRSSEYYLSECGVLLERGWIGFTPVQNAKTGEILANLFLYIKDAVRQNIALEVYADKLEDDGLSGSRLEFKFLMERIVLEESA